MQPATYLRLIPKPHAPKPTLPRLACVALCLFAAMLTAPGARAQYMYMDSNGDGVHTAADVITATGTTVAKVYLRTNRLRDGSTAVCPTGDQLTINS